MAIFDFSVYTLAQTLFLVLAFVDNKISVKNKNIFFGWPLIILLCAIIVVKQFFSIKDSIISIKEKCKKLKEEKNDEKENFNKAKQVQPGPIDKPENSSTSLNQQPIMIAIAPNKISSARNQALSRKRIKAEAESVPRPKIKFGNLENIGQNQGSDNLDVKNPNNRKKKSLNTVHPKVEKKLVKNDSNLNQSDMWNLNQEQADNDFANSRITNEQNTIQATQNNKKKRYRNNLRKVL